ncbi:MAG: T9SS type A sorting domain-containing protein [Bacteroidota bacterium]|jgi:hypothetical protein|nr:T9SS type A sorting domain-containing protein [Flammeovirgaceae bacterium]MCZ8069773.1 T9SS type A sorting domain-containing protein [Cytophagales bacterium]
MKKFVVISFLCFLFSTVNAQVCPTQNNGPDTWDWRSPTYTFYLKGANYLATNGVVPMPSPWYGGSGLNPNVNKFYQQNPRDFEPTDGWELVQRQFGSPTNLIDHPYFILYNKYSGILRIFVAISTVVGQNNSAVITLTYPRNGKRTAVLELLSPNGYVNALTEFDNQIPTINQANDYHLTLPYWLHADFVMNYDPCTCNVNNNQLYFNVSLVSNSTLSFELSGQAIQNMDNLGRKGSGKQGFSTVVEDLKDIVDGGVSFHSSAKSGLDMLAEVFPSVNYAENPVYNIIPGVGAAVGIVSKLIGVFTDKPNEVEPLVFDINLKSKNGSINTSNPHAPILVDNPGSQVALQALVNYKNVMGVFTLLEPPKLNVVVSGAFSPYYIGGAFYDVTLAENLKYAINPSAGFDISKSTITAAYVYENSNPNFSSLSYFTNMTYINDSTLITSFAPIGSLTSFKARAAVPHVNNSNPFPNGAIHAPTVYLKIAAILRKTDPDGVLHESVFVAKYKTQIVSTTNLTTPASSPSTPPFSDWIEVTTGWGGSAGQFNVGFVRYGSKSVGLLGKYTTANGSEVIYLSDNSVKLIGSSNSSIGAGITLKVASSGGETFIPETDPTPYCSNPNYVVKQNQFARESQREDSPEAFNPENETTAFPNPTSSKVSFRYYIEEPSQVRLSLINTTGSVVATPVDAYQEAGAYEMSYDASNLPAGIYIYTLETSMGKETKRLVVLK